MLMKPSHLPLLVFATFTLISVALAQDKTPTNEGNSPAPANEEHKPAEEESQSNTVRTQSIGSVRRFCNDFPNAPQCENIDQ